jgi:hypothetical protein
MIDSLEEFADEFGENVQVVVNRNDRSYPVYMKASGPYPGMTEAALRSSGYFEYIDEEYEDDSEDDEALTLLCVLND